MVEHLDGHTDIINKMLYSDWLPWSDLKPHYKNLFINVLLLTHRGLQGDETKRFIVASILEKGE